MSFFGIFRTSSNHRLSSKHPQKDTSDNHSHQSDSKNLEKRDSFFFSNSSNRRSSKPGKSPLTAASATAADNPSVGIATAFDVRTEGTSGKSDPDQQIDDCINSDPVQRIKEERVVQQQLLNFNHSAMNVAGEQLSIVVVKHLRNDIGPSTIEIQTEEGASLQLVLLDSLRSKFTFDKSKKKFKLESSDSDSILLEVLKGLRFYGWHLLTSNSFMHHGSSTKKVEATFYFEKVITSAAVPASNAATTTTAAAATVSQQQKLAAVGSVVNKKSDDGTASEEKNGSTSGSEQRQQTAAAATVGAASGSSSFGNRRQSFNREKLVQKYSQHRKSTFSQSSSNVLSGVAAVATDDSALPSYQEAVSPQQQTNAESSSSSNNNSSSSSSSSSNSSNSSSEGNDDNPKRHSSSLSNVQLAYQQALANNKTQSTVNSPSTKPPLSKPSFLKSSASLSSPTNVEKNINNNNSNVNTTAATTASDTKSSGESAAVDAKAAAATPPPHSAAAVVAATAGQEQVQSVQKPPDRQQMTALSASQSQSGKMGNMGLAQDTIDDADCENVRPVRSMDDEALQLSSSASRDESVGPAIMNDMRKIQSMRPPSAKERSEHDNNKVSHYSKLGSAFFSGNSLGNNRRGGRGTGRL